MPQEHYVLKCFSCETFQVHIVKKAKKWECKMCGAKQSVKRNYGRGSGKDCRNHVMKLNERRLMDGCNSNIADDGVFDDDFTDIHVSKVEPDTNKTLTSKWEKYLEEPLIHSENELDDCMSDIYTDSEEKKKKRVKKMSEDSVSKKKKICREPSVNNVSPKVISPLFSPISDNKNFESCNMNQTPTEKKCQIQFERKLKFNKYAKFLDSDEENDGKRNKNEDKKDIEEKKCQIQFENKLKFNKYAKFLDSDEDDDGKGNKIEDKKDIEEKKCQIQFKNKLEFKKYAKFLDCDEEHDGKRNKNEDKKDINKLSNIFDSDPNDLDNIFSLECLYK